jgi:hypothetical protein
MLHNTFKKGSMLITAVFVILVFTSLIAIVSRLIIGSNQTQLTSVLGTQADALARSGTEFALAALFFPNTANSSESAIWGIGKGPENYKSSALVLIDNCKGNNDQNFCSVVYSGCYINKLSILVKDLNSSDSYADVKYEYIIDSEAICEVPFNDNSEGNRYYNLTRHITTTATDVRWRDTF